MSGVWNRLKHYGKYRGYPFSEGSPWRGWYNHLLPPNSACGIPNGLW